MRLPPSPSFAPPSGASSTLARFGVGPSAASVVVVAEDDDDNDDDDDDDPSPLLPSTRGKYLPGAPCRNRPSNATCLPIRGWLSHAHLTLPFKLVLVTSDGDGERLFNINVGTPYSVRYVIVATLGWSM
jgi:hypothetical protein